MPRNRLMIFYAAVCFGFIVATLNGCGVLRDAHTLIDMQRCGSTRC